jgi:voltage-gated potassium channel
MAVLTIVYVAIGFVDDQFISLNLPAYWYLPFLGIFLAEFFVRFVDAKSRTAYLRGHWIDLATSVPMIGGIRLFRLLRLLRLVKIGSLIRTAMLRRNRQDTWFVWPTILLFWISSAYTLWLFEHGLNSRVSSFGDALYLSFMTASTVGYGDISPVTTEGKVTAGLIVFFALGLLGFASSRLTTWWLGAHDDRDMAALIARLAELERELKTNQDILLDLHRRMTTADVDAPGAVVAGRPMELGPSL